MIHGMLGSALKVVAGRRPLEVDTSDQDVPDDEESVVEVSGMGGEESTGLNTSPGGFVG